jgi:peptidoglycan hydrolase-like protein with peptidoglycan-binding domain
MSSLLTYSFGNECVLSEPPSTGGDKIGSSVGENGRNIADDVRTVQNLLNGVPLGSGGAAGKPLKVDGVAGPLTKAAIKQFQIRQLLRADGRVDPEGPTLKKLRALNLGGGLSGQAAPATPGVVSPPGNITLRLATALLVAPEVRSALVRARSAIEGLLFTPPGGFFRQRAEILFNQHFGSPGNQEKDSFRFVVRNYANMLSAADNPRPSLFGGTFANFYDIDPINFVKNQAGEPIFGYVRIRGRENPALDAAGIDFTKIYLTAAVDGRPRDQFTLLGLHELAHLSSNQGAAVFLADNAYGFQPKYFTIPHQLRLRNADSYANFAFENAFGNARLAAVVPGLRVISL